MNNNELRKDPRKKNPMNNPIMPGLIVLFALGLGACSSGSQSGTNANSAGTKASNTPAATRAAANTESVPAALMDAGEYGENIYDYAKANDWKKAEARIAALKEATKKVRADGRNQPTKVDRLERLMLLTWIGQSPRRTGRPLCSQPT